MPREHISADQWEREAEGEERMPSRDNGPVTERSSDGTAALLREVLSTLKRIEATQAKHEQLIMRVGLRVKAIDERATTTPRRPSAAPAQDTRAVASDRELDGERGNPMIKNDPKGWTGESYRGQRYSDCPAEYLEKVAEQLDKFAWFNQKDAAKARGWAERNRKNPPAQASPALAPTASSDDNEWG